MNPVISEDFFTDFVWAIPSYFTAALAECRFEKGDVLYASRKGYQREWRSGNPPVPCIQIQSPERGSALKTGDGVAFAECWNSEVGFDFFGFHIPQERTFKPKQGQLYTFLKTGDYNSLLSPQEVPLSVREAHPLSAEAAESIKHQMTDSKFFPVHFVMPFEFTNSISQFKYQVLKEVFESNFEAVEFFFDAKKLDWNFGKLIWSPTFRFLCFGLNAKSIPQVEAVIKRALYKPVADKLTSRENYRLSTHGVLLSNLN